MIFRFMSFEEFETLSSPAKLNLPLQALWHDAHGDWHRAHELAQQAADRAGDRVHAYLHRKEGDEGNALYWYRRLGLPVPTQSLKDEWRTLVKQFLNT
jgi:hypothetical protein